MFNSRQLNKIQLIVVFISCVYTINGQELPVNTCPQYFQYQTDGQQWFGLITLEHLPVDMHKIEIGLTQKGLPAMMTHENIDSYPDVETVSDNLLKGQPITLRVNFPLPHEPAKVTGLLVDGNTLCSSSRYPPPGSWYTLYYTIKKPLHAAYESRFNYVYQFETMNNRNETTARFNQTTTFVKNF